MQSNVHVVKVFFQPIAIKHVAAAAAASGCLFTGFFAAAQIVIRPARFPGGELLQYGKPAAIICGADTCRWERRNAAAAAGRHICTSDAANSKARWPAWVASSATGSL